MRWQEKPWPKLPSSGDERTRSRFLLFPICINMEYRWLEHAEWVERYSYSYALMGYRGWVPVRWLNNGEQ